MFSPGFTVCLIIAWLAAAVGGGAALAFLTKRIHKSLSFKKNWLFFSALLAIAMAALFGVALR
jgi:hypothetical protein